MLQPDASIEDVLYEDFLVYMFIYFHNIITWSVVVSLLLSRKFIINFYDIWYEEWFPCIATMFEGLKSTGSIAAIFV